MCHFNCSSFEILIVFCWIWIWKSHFFPVFQFLFVIVHISSHFECDRVRLRSPFYVLVISSHMSALFIYNLMKMLLSVSCSSLFTCLAHTVLICNMHNNLCYCEQCAIWYFIKDMCMWSMDMFMCINSIAFTIS